MNSIEEIVIENVDASKEQTDDIAGCKEARELVKALAEVLTDGVKHASYELSTDEWNFTVKVDAHRKKE